MPAAKTYTQQQKDAALALYETDGPTAVEKQLGIPKNTVAGWARKAGTRTVRTAKTNAATKAKQADDKTMRALIASDALSVVQTVSGILAGRLANNPDEIPTRDLITMYGVLTDKHLAIVKTDVETENHSAVDAWLEHVTGAISGKLE